MCLCILIREKTKGRSDLSYWLDEVQIMAAARSMPSIMAARLKYVRALSRSATISRSSL